MKKLLFVFLSCTFLNVLMAQKNFWTSHAKSDVMLTDKAVERLSFPREFRLFNLNTDLLREELFSVAGNRSARYSVIISLPNAEGQIEQFEVFEASNFDVALQDRFPEIRAFSGKGITDKYATLKLSISPQGIQTMVFRTDKENEFIEPYSQDHSVYAVFKSQRKPGQLPWTCSTDDQKSFSAINAKVGDISFATGSSTGQLKTLRLAQSVTAEYSNYFGATSASQAGMVLAAINATLTRCNGVYEKDLALHLNLIANTTAVIYYNASTDPYDNGSTGSGGTWNNQLQSTLTSVIGEANYDIGHLFGASGGGGNAGCIGCICTNGQKGKGFTSPADGIPQGDNFDIDYVVHEIGHQLGANHTFSSSLEGTGVNKEVGSGITIMGYAGITSYDVAPHSIDIYHEASIAQIQANLAAKTCAVTTNISANNATPVISAVSNYTIPISTPFALTASASDANGDALTYCWEQNDNSTVSGASSKASPTKTSGPNWLTFRPSTSPTRMCPVLTTVLAGGLTTGPLPGGDAGVTIEALSSVSRTLNFRLTVRDNAPYSSTAPVKVGQTAFTDMVVTVTNTSGPFAVSAPNTAVSYAGGSAQNITWSVANTTSSPVSCANVKISLSTDGGQTFPAILIASTPNDGSQTLTIPNTPTTAARIKIEAVGNIFFDLSNTNFTITAGSSCGAPTGLTSSAVTASGATVSWAAVSGAVSYDVDYKPASASTWSNAATATGSTSANISGLSASTVYDWRVRTNCSGSSSVYAAAQFTTAAAPVCNAPLGLSASGITTSSAMVSWNAVSGAVSYDVDYKLSSSSTWTNAATATVSTSVTINSLASSTTYDWRVRTNCSFGASGYAAAQFTTNAVFVCNAPTGLTASSVTASGATVSWTAVSGAVSYDVDYKLTTTSTWTNAATGTSSTSVIINGLASSTVYDWQVRTNCSGGSSSYAASQFTTGTASTCSTAFEPNETQATAAAVNSGITNTAAISSSADIDYYKITTGALSNIIYNLAGPSGVDYDLYIYNSSGTQVGAGTGSTATETVTLNSQAAGTYYIKVAGYNGANSSTCYTIKATATPTGCQSSYDVSTNGTTSGASTIPFNTNITGLISPSGDVDNYKFIITTGGTITITLGTLPGDYDLKLLNSSGAQVAISQNGNTNSETINYTAAAGTYYAQVYGYNGANSASVCYTLKVQLGTASKRVTAIFAANDHVKIYPNPVSSRLYITIPGELAFNSSLTLLDAKGMIISEQALLKNVHTLDVSKLAKGVYLLKISNGKTVITERFVKQ